MLFLSVPWHGGSQPGGRFLATQRRVLSFRRQWEAGILVEDRVDLSPQTLSFIQGPVLCFVFGRLHVPLSLGFQLVRIMVSFSLHALLVSQLLRGMMANVAYIFACYTIVH